MSAFPTASVWEVRRAIWAAREVLTRAREDLAAAVAAQDPDRHFRGLRESPEVIAAYDAVRDAEKAVAKVEKGNCP